MSIIENRPNTALFVIDMQKGIIKRAHERNAVVARIGSLVKKARQEQILVIWLQHSDVQLARGSEEWEMVPESTPGDAEPPVEKNYGDAEPPVEKNYGDAFEDTSLETVLSGFGVGRLVVVGAQSDACIRSTLHGAFVRCYSVTLVSNSHDGGPDSMGGAARPGPCVHESLLDLPQGAAADGWDGRGQRCRLRSLILKAASLWSAPTPAGTCIGEEY